MTAEEAVVEVAVSSNKTSNRLAMWLAIQAFLKCVAGAAALSDLVGNRVAGVVLMTIAGLDAATATYLAATNRNPMGSSR